MGNTTCGVCGGNLAFSPKNQNLECTYCSSAVEISPGITEIHSYPIEEGMEKCDVNWGTELKAVHCNSCGADMNMDRKSISQVCGFCDSPHVESIEGDPGIVPESLIPFQIEKKNADSAFKEWLKKKWFAPKEVKSKARAENLTGIYLPYMAFDTETSTRYRGRRGRRVTTGTGKNRTTRMRWTPVSGWVSRTFKNFSVTGSHKLFELGLDDEMTFDFRQLVGYHADYLVGFVSERLAIGISDAWSRAKTVMRSEIEGDVKRDIGGQAQQVTSMDVTHLNSRYKCLLCPAWVSVFYFDGKEYSFVVNGQTGRVYGKYPLSKKRIGIAVGLGLLVAAAVYFMYIR